MRGRHHSELENINKTMALLQLRKRQLVSSQMARILDKLPGAPSIMARAKLLGVQRQTIYNWLNGISRPNWRLALEISRLTDIPAADIHGQSPDRRTALAASAAPGVRKSDGDNL